jgi:ElaB/YqjD/DUF883 family membrane-anchored ribosome-binding protein
MISDATSPDSANASDEPDLSCEARLAADAVRLAKLELQKAQAAYERARQQATERVKAIRETDLGTVIDRTLVAVKRHPGASLTIAALAGFYLGRFLGPKR